MTVSIYGDGQDQCVRFNTGKTIVHLYLYGGVFCIGMPPRHVCPRWPVFHGSLQATGLRYPGIAKDIRRHAEVLGEQYEAVYMRLFCKPSGVPDYQVHDRLMERLPELMHLTELDLSGLELRQLPVPICQLKHLEKLNLSNNALEQLPDTFDQLVNLKDLDLSGNKFLELPGQICNMGLTQLNMECNGLSYFDEDSPNLPNIERIFVAGNKDLKVIPLSWQGVVSLAS